LSDRIVFTPQKNCHQKTCQFTTQELAFTTGKLSFTKLLFTNLKIVIPTLSKAKGRNLLFPSTSTTAQVGHSLNRLVVHHPKTCHSPT
jgi:hypothetical protein